MENVKWQWIYISVLCSLGLINGQGSIDFQTYVVCYREADVTVLQFNCQGNELILINNAYNGQTAYKQPRYCENPTSDKDLDCIKFQNQRTDDLLTDCGRRSSCRSYLSFKDIPCGDDFTGYNYLAVEYACYTKYNNGTDGVYYHYVDIDLEHKWRLGNRGLIYTNQYPQWRSAYDESGACQVTLPPGGYLIVHLLDFRGRLIDAREGCPVELTLHDGTNWYHRCGQRDWTYTKYVLRPRSAPWRVDLILSTEMEEQSEGRLQMLIEGMTSSDVFVESMNMVCGKALDGLYTTTTTTTSTSTTSTTTTSTTTTTTTTTTPTPTTTTIPPTTTTTTVTPTTTTNPPTTTTTTVKPTTVTTEVTGEAGSDSTLPGSNGNAPVGVTDKPGKSTNWGPIIVGSAVGGIVVLVLIILGTVLGCTRKSKKQPRIPAANPNSNDVIFASNGNHGPNGHLSDPRLQKNNHKKHNNAGLRNKNPYIMNNKRSTIGSSRSAGPDEFYSEIQDGSTTSNTWMTDNINLAVNYPRSNATITVDHDPSFEEPTEMTLKLAKGTTRGFNY